MNSTLPVFNFINQIVNTVRKHQVTIITAETGAGKSTQVPQMLLAEGYKLVVTQPRRLAARTLAGRVAFEMNEELGETIGLRTRDDRVVSENNRCLFATDGLAMVRELMSHDTQEKILVLDEVHEWNLNVEVLVAWTKLQVAQNPKFRTVLMSATLEAERLSAYFGGAPVITVPGRQYPVEVRQPSSKLEFDVDVLVKQRRNVLVFVPGKNEIFEVTKNLKDLGINAEILPLHGELLPQEQAQCFKRYGRPKVVVSTNVAQTSVTIDDIDAVVDSGMEKRVELNNGVEGLFIKPISLADSAQRKGRAGRTKPGIYIDHCPHSDRAEFPTAEILRTRLDQTVLRLAEAGIDAEELEFFHQPDRAQIHEAREVLKLLGCMDQHGQVTKIGHRIAQMPLNVKFARMIIEAERLGVVGDIIDVAAILENGREITDRKNLAWYPLVGQESESDLLGQVKVFRAALNFKKKEEFERHGIFAKAFYKVREIRGTLLESLANKVASLESTGDREAIMKCVMTGMIDHVFMHRYGSDYNNSKGTRRLNQFSLVRAGAKMLVGIPFDLQFIKRTRFGDEIPMTLELINMATVIQPEWLTEIAPHLYRTESGLSPFYDSFHQTVRSYTRVFLGDRMLEEKLVDDPNHAQAHELKERHFSTIYRSIMGSSRTLGTHFDNAGTRRSFSEPVLPQRSAAELEAERIRREEEDARQRKIWEDLNAFREGFKTFKEEVEEYRRRNFRKLGAIENAVLTNYINGPEAGEKDKLAWLAKAREKFAKFTGKK